jgi:hypothetical protein
MAGMASDEPYIYATRIVRVFPDYANSVIWFSDPVGYDETRLSEGLVARLMAWEASYYSGLTENLEWRSPDLLHLLSSEGLELARAVAHEIGPEFEVEYRSFEDVRATALLRSEGSASNPSARDAFAARAASARKEWAATRERDANTAPGSGGGWYGGAASGAIFRPHIDADKSD